ncbi:zinc ribbon domain-containing protein [Microaceticoccus formicicus]|uniref:zinc ribbon domain-containing protein n=1 Tax=Microaceticoccus formicicus TaxID=3118105 RepID=UPI003CD03277|nr:zinc-ribbon domain-containing protein [Peptoniphilaceae bacterium AMB_02]
MTKCKNCGFEVDATDNFCKKCGTEVDHTIDPICTNCGFEYAEGDKFCKKCGTKIEAVQSGKPVSEKPEFDKSDFDKSEFDKIKFDYKKPYDQLYDDVIDSSKEEVKTDTKKTEGFFKSSESEKTFAKIENDDKEFSESELEVPSFFGKSKKVISEMFNYDTTDEKINTEDKTEVVNKDSNIDKAFKPGNNQEQENKDHTVLLPSIEEYEQSSRFENRVVLSDEKKRLIRESKEKADNINHEIEKPEIEESDDALTLTQKLKVGNEADRSMENRKVRSSARKKKAPEETDSDVQKSKEKKVDEKKPFKWSNLLIPTLIVLAVCTFLYATLSGLTDKKRVIAKFENAITEENTQSLTNLVVSSNENVAINEDALKPFSKLMKSDQIYRSSLIGAIKEDSSKLGIDENYKSNRAYRLENTGKKFLFFKDYKVVVDPLQLSVTAPEDAKYTLMDKEISGNSENMVLLPGLYDVENKVNGEKYQINLSPTNENLQDGNLIVSLSSLTPITQDNDVETEGKPQEQPPETIPEDKPVETPVQDSKWEGETEFHIDTTQKEAMVYINDENTNLTVEQYNQIPLKSVVSGDRIKIGIEYPWGMGFSKEMTLSGETLISLYVDMDNEGTMNHIMSRIEKMLKEDGMARRNMSMDGFTTIIEPELSTTRDILQRGIDNGMTYYRVYDELQYDASSFVVNSGENGSYTAYIGGNLKFHATEYPKDESMEDGYQPYELTQLTGFNLTYLPVKNEWFISSWGEADRAINLENPVVHEIGE